MTRRHSQAGQHPRRIKRSASSGGRWAFVLVLALAVDGAVAADTCAPLHDVDSKVALIRLRQAFRQAGVYPMERVSLQPVKRCNGTVSSLFEAKLVYGNGGPAWLVSQDLATGKATVQQVY
ncbi:hypothetical protein [Dyella sp. ASV21]|uniref:hypothetical protein n=1 Tax=Dyella sp. ASV21 TaxID=2795114 RepID=UPI0018EBC3D8|nr:hypothetical protein [Dyella sp. ASV21]